MSTKAKQKSPVFVGLDCGEKTRKMKIRMKDDIDTAISTGVFPTLKQVVGHANKLKEASLGVILESISPKGETT